jgi:predicted ArsR family transcriptional regulator
MGDVIRLFEDSPLESAWWQNHGPKAVHHSQTSIDAAAAIKPGTLRAQVLELIQRHPEGLTDEEGTELSGLNPSTYRPRRVELATMNLIEAVGTAKTKSGRQAQVWRECRKGDREDTHSAGA